MIHKILLAVGLPIGTLIIAFVLVWIARKALDWLAQESHDRMCRINDREANAHRITVNFRVGGDAK